MVGTTQLWTLVRAERETLCEFLGNLEQDQWQQESQCPPWTVRHIVAHIAAAGSTATGAWLANMLRSGFNTDRHNARLLEKFLGDSPDQTFENFRNSCDNSIAPLNSVPGLLGEVVVHSQDIAVPLGITLQPGAEAVWEVAEFFVSNNFAVNSKTLAKGLKIVAVDQEFTVGTGPEVRGKLLDIVMVLAGRRHGLAQLDGDGVQELQRRLG
ncbi:maleylpyruvate isomerase family mycothiol-dependent enzyme [Glutamicibacter arilaitensis]|uniref:maleylpyruvate isomerase family mycothiol-dependent enzyme n=1 Tax=Glutamicibacter arilaitensis TaxID=256701 RepID=UPI003A9504E8